MGNDGRITDKVLRMPSREQGGWIPLKDDGCRWITDLPGGPFAVLPCTCGSPVAIESTANIVHHRVRCLQCGKHSPEVIGGQLLDVLTLWNEMVD